LRVAKDADVVDCRNLPDLDVPRRAGISRLGTGRR
jgi:hypothetical protein